MKSLIYIYILLLFISQISFAEVSVKIINSNGDAKVRFGLEENWNKATAGIQLKEIDTILTGENGEIVQEKELFLYLMSKKVENFEHRKGKTKLRIGNISSTYGEDKAKKDSTVKPIDEKSKKEINGAIALYIQEYYTNTLYKLHTLLDKYKSTIDMGEVHFFIAKAFEALDKKGQAIDSYQLVLEIYQGLDSLDVKKKEYLSESLQALKKLKSDHN